MLGLGCAGDDEFLQTSRWLLCEGAYINDQGDNTGSTQSKYGQNFIVCCEIHFFCTDLYAKSEASVSIERGIRMLYTGDRPL